MAIFIPVALLVAAQVAQCPAYQLNFVQGLDCGTILGHPLTSGWGITPSGAGCGYFLDCNFAERAFVWSSIGSFSPIAFSFPVSAARAVSLNENGVATGYVDPNVTPFYRRAFMSVNGNASLLPIPDGHLGSEAYGINSQGLIVGYSASGPEQAMLWQNGVPTPIPLPLGPSNVANDINDVNQICGWMGTYPLPEAGATAFIWSAGVTTSLPLPRYAIAQSAAANALNNRGDACGFFFVATSPVLLRRACAWIDGQFMDLGVLPGYNRSYALDINDAREVIGYCQPIQGGANVGFIWRNGAMSSLGSLAGVADTTFKFPRAINNRGQITGDGIGPHSTAAFLLTPSLPATPGDTNCDGHANVNDLLAVITHWNPPGPVGGDPADLNRDNRIDVNDLLAVVVNWG